MGKLEKTISIKDRDATVVLSGTIDEDTTFNDINQLKQTRITFDFNKVAYINSCGIREWINYLDGLDHNIEVIYKNCPEIVVEQINMVSGLIKEDGVVESFYAPYYCENCDVSKRILLNSSTVEDNKTPVVSCDKCNKAMEFDAIPQQYFSFLQRRRKNRR